MREKERKPAYRRLSGKERKLFALFNAQIFRLLLAEDCVMHVRSTTYTESVKRFYLKDIQAITVCRTKTGARLNLLFVILMVVFPLLAALGFHLIDENEEVVSLLIVGGIGLAVPASWLVANIVKGPTCVCRLYTAVQMEEVVALCRLRRAQRAIETLKPLIEAAQGALSPEDLGTQEDGAVELHAAQHAVPRGTIDLGSQQPLRHDSGHLHLAAFLMLLIVAGLAAMEVFFPSPLKDIADTMGFDAAVILAVLALLRQRHSDLPSGVKTGAWAALIALAVGFSMHQMLGVLYIVIENKGDYFEQSMAWGTHIEGPLFYTWSAILAVLYATIAILGLMRLRMTQYATEPDATPEPALVTEPEPSAPEPAPDEGA